MFDREQLMFNSQMETALGSLEFQKQRIFQVPSIAIHSLHVSPVHDVDFYLILLRRLYRQLEKISKYDSRVANLKGKNSALTAKIKIRDHFEHGLDLQQLPVSSTKGLPGVSSDSGLKIATSVFINQKDAFIVSGSFRWDLHKDHEQFIKIMGEMIKFYPYTKSE